MGSIAGGRAVRPLRNTLYPSTLVASGFAGRIVERIVGVSVRAGCVVQGAVGSLDRRTRRKAKPSAMRSFPRSRVIATLSMSVPRWWGRKWLNMT
jgi:hypothetical protein